MKGKVFYLCDRRKCRNCTFPTCKHTTNIFYASNFYLENGDFFEKENEYIKQAKENAYFDTLNLIYNLKNEYGEDDDRRIILERLENEIKQLLHK